MKYNNNSLVLTVFGLISCCSTAGGQDLSVPAAWRVESFFSNRVEMLLSQHTETDNLAIASRYGGNGPVRR